MSKPITLTERERAVFSHVARTLGKGRIADDVIVSNAILHFLDMDFRVRTESASPPRVPVDSAATDDLQRLKDPVTLHTNLLRGFPASLTMEQRLHLVGSIKIDEIRAEGYRAGIEVAAQQMDAEGCSLFSKRIRALTDKPALDPLLPGLEYVYEAMAAGDLVGLDWLKVEIAARKGG